MPAISSDLPLQDFSLPPLADLPIDCSEFLDLGSSASPPPPQGDARSLSSYTESSYADSSAPSLIMGQGSTPDVPRSSRTRTRPTHAPTPLGFIWDSRDISKKSMLDMYLASPPAALWCSATISFIVGLWMSLPKVIGKFSSPLQNTNFFVYSQPESMPLHRTIGELMSVMKGRTEEFQEYTGAAHWLGKRRFSSAL
jgi:hypothetical protein